MSNFLSDKYTLYFNFFMKSLFHKIVWFADIYEVGADVHVF